MFRCLIVRLLGRSMTLFVEGPLAVILHDPSVSWDRPSREPLSAITEAPLSTRAGHTALFETAYG